MLAESEAEITRKEVKDRAKLRIKELHREISMASNERKMTPLMTKRECEAPLDNEIARKSLKTRHSA